MCMEEGLYVHQAQWFCNQASTVRTEAIFREEGELM